MKRKIVQIDEELCNGCSQCIPNCHEGALQMIDNKARLISDLFCDGLGNCMGHCPQGAITIVKREAKKYDEKKVMEENIVPKGKNTIKAHLEHLRDHGAIEYLDEALGYLRENNLENPMGEKKVKKEFCSCPGSKEMDFSDETIEGDISGKRPSQLRQWPIQLHLVSPMAPYFKNADVVLAADCTAFSLGDFHKDYLKDNSLAIACPKLDDSQETYLDKLTSLIEDAKVNTLTVLTMEVPCCAGLLALAKKALDKSDRKIPIKSVVVGIKGNILSDAWV